MIGLGERLKRLLTGAPPGGRAKAKRPPAKTGATDRAAVIAAAMAVYRTGRVQGRDALDQIAADLRAKLPTALHDREGLERLLALHRAHTDLRKLLGHDLKRYLVLAGIRQWLGEGGPPSSSARVGSGRKPSRRIATKR